MHAAAFPTPTKPPRQSLDLVAHTFQSKATGLSSAIHTARGNVLRGTRLRKWRFNSQKVRKMISQVQADLQSTQHQVEAEVGEFIQSPHLLFQPIRLVATLTLPMLIPLFFMPTAILILYTAFVGIWYLTCVLLFATEVAMRPPWYKKGLSNEGLPPYWSNYVHDPYVDFGATFEHVEFMSSSGALLRGWFIPPAVPPPADQTKNMVVFVHGVGRDRRTFLRHAEHFVEQGYSCLLFDFAEHGLSDGVSDGISRGTLFGAREQYDVIAAVEFLRTAKGAEQVAIVGTSCGATSAILAAARIPNLCVCVVAENPFTRADDLLKHHLDILSRNYLSQNSHQTVRRLIFWLAGKVLMFRMGYYMQSYGAVDAVTELTCPLLVAHSAADDIVPFEHGQRIYEAALNTKKGPTGMIRFLRFNDAAHCALFDKNPEFWTSEVLSFVDTSFGRDSKRQSQ